ncbi:c-type heme family protein [Desulforhopalus sp. 52FAK]
MEAKRKGNIVFTFIDASRNFFKNEQRPLVMDIVEEDRFYPNLMSGFAFTRGIWDEFMKELPDYQFRQATIDPLYPPNKASSDELKIIAEFEANKNLKSKEGILEKDGERFFYFAKPIKVGKKCLRCHGNPDDAPRDQIELYGKENGYHWQENATVASFITYVPIQNALEDAKKSAITLFLFGLGGITVLMAIIWFFFNSYLIKPITMLETRTTEISLGKNLDQNVTHSSNDEIGTLAKAIDRMRISTVKLLQRCKK